MLPQLSQEIINEYASEAQTIQQPQGSDYVQGVRVGRTIPAKWWNWLFSAVTKRVTQSRSDADNMLTELKNVVTDAGITPDTADNTQLKEAIDIKAQEQLDKYLEYKRGFVRRWVSETTTGLPQNYVDVDNFTSSYTISDVREIHGVYFTVVHAIRYYLGNVTSERHALAFSYDMVHWNTIDAATFGLNISFNCMQFTAAVEFFKGYWFIRLQGMKGGLGANAYYYYVFVRLDSLENLSSYTVLYSAEHASTIIEAQHFQQALFIAGDRLYCKFPTDIDDYLSYTTDGLTFTSQSTGLGILVGGDQTGWTSAQAKPYNGGYLIGDLWVSGNYQTWANYNGYSIYGAAHNVVAITGSEVYIMSTGTCVFKYANTVVYKLSPDTASVQISYQIMHVADDRSFVVLQANGTYHQYMTVDFTNFIDLNKNLTERTVAICPEPINGVWYAVGLATRTWYKNTDIENNDWEDTGLTVPGSFSLYENILQMFYDTKILICGPKFSRDAGESWQDIALLNGTAYTPQADPPALFITGNKYYNLVPYNITTAAGRVDSIWTQKVVNFVRGHTLYLM